MFVRLSIVSLIIWCVLPLYSFAGYSPIPLRPEERKAVRVADIEDEAERLIALKVALRPYIEHAPTYGFRWTRLPNYLELTGLTLNPDTWEMMSKELGMTDGFYVSKDPIDSATYGEFLQIIKFPEKLEFLSTHRMGISFVNHGPGPVLIAFGYASEYMTDAGYFTRPKEEQDRLMMFYSDIKKLGIVATIYTDTWINIKTPIKEIEILSPKNFLEKAKSDPLAQKWLQSFRFQRALGMMKNSDIPSLCRRVYSRN